MKRYEIVVTWNATATVEVDAHSEEEALEYVYNHLDFDASEVELDAPEVQECNEVDECC